MLNFPAFWFGTIGPEAVYRFETPKRLFWDKYDKIGGVVEWQVEKQSSEEEIIYLF